MSDVVGVAYDSVVVKFLARAVEDADKFETKIEASPAEMLVGGKCILGGRFRGREFFAVFVEVVIVDVAGRFDVEVQGAENTGQALIKRCLQIKALDGGPYPAPQFLVEGGNVMAGLKMQADRYGIQRHGASPFPEPLLLYGVDAFSEIH